MVELVLAYTALSVGVVIFSMGMFVNVSRLLN